MHSSLINPYVRLAMKSVISSGDRIMCRVIYDYELLYLERGEFTLVYDGVAYQCHAGDIIFIRPGIEHSFIIDRGEISQPHVHFDVTHRPQSEKIPVSFKSFDDMSETERGMIHKDYFASYPKTPFLHIKNREEFLDAFYRAVSKATSPLMKKSLMIQLLSLIINDNFPEALEEQEYSPVENQIKDYLDSGNGLTMSLDDLEKRFFHSKFYLEKRFKDAFGVGIIEYRNKKRMERADCLLESYSVSEVAQMLGYQSIYSFSRAYKQCRGASPSKRKEGNK